MGKFDWPEVMELVIALAFCAWMMAILFLTYATYPWTYGTHPWAGRLRPNLWQRLAFMWNRDVVRNAFVRLLVSLGVAFAVSATAYLCAWRDYRTSMSFNDAHYSTMYRLDDIRDAIETQRTASGKLPQSLRDLKEVQSGRIPLDSTGQLVDVWGNPYQYHVENGGYSLFSFGPDGQAGGVGIDADIYPSSEGRKQELPTLWQFTVVLPTGGIQDTCALAGACAGLVSLFFRRKSAVIPQSRLLLIQAGVTVGAATFVAVVMSAFHLPPVGGH